jgi:hypothetical protein
MSTVDSQAILSLQTTGSIIAIVCTVVDILILSGFILSFLGIGLYDVNPKVLNLPNSVTPGNSPYPSAIDQNNNTTPTLRKKLENFPFPIRFAVLSFFFSAVASAVAGSERMLRSQPQNVCSAYSKTGLSLYILAKTSTLVFLGSRAALVYEFSGSRLCCFVSRRFVIIFTGISLIGFAVTFFLTLFDATVMLNQVLLQTIGICNTPIPIQINAALNVVDGASSIILLFVFVLPMIEVAKEVLKESNKGMNSTTSLVMLERFEALQKIIKTNLIIGGVTTSLALICSCAVTAIELQPANTGITVIGGSIRTVDLTANCVMQLYAMKNYFQRKEIRLAPSTKDSGDKATKTLQKLDMPLLLEDKLAE